MALGLIQCVCVDLSLYLTLSCSHSTADLHSLLDVAKIADSLIFVLDPSVGWDSYGEYCLSCLFAQGLPTHGKLLVDLSSP